MADTPVVLSGIQPSGGLHIGNYLGALRPWVLGQEKYRNYFCIVDLHAVTVYQEPKLLREQTRQLAALYIAAGLDPKHSTIFVQSHVRAHAEISWLLTCITPMGWLGRMTQFKDKSGNTEAESVQSGLYIYPVLMAADILAYQADFVPVGEDQRQHLELTRDIAMRFNRLYGETFKIPQALIGHTGAGAKIMGLDDPTKKMSKSDSNPGHAIKLLDTPDQMKKKIMRATTDSGSAVDVQNAGPGVTNLIEIYRAVTGATKEIAWDSLNGVTYGTLKTRVADAVLASLEPLQKRYAELMKSPTELDVLLKEGAGKASEVAEKTAALVRTRMGIG